MPELWGPSNERIWRFLGLEGDDEQPDNDPPPPPRYLTPILLAVGLVLVGMAIWAAL